MSEMKDVWFWGNALDDLREFPKSARREAGYQIDRVQHGFDPDDWKTMTSIGAGVREFESATTQAHSGSSTLSV